MTTHADEATAWLADRQPAILEAIAPLVDQNSYTENPEGGRKVGAMLRALNQRPSPAPLVIADGNRSEDRRCPASFL